MREAAGSCAYGLNRGGLDPVRVCYRRVRGKTERATECRSVLKFKAFRRGCTPSLLFVR